MIPTWRRLFQNGWFGEFDRYHLPLAMGAWTNSVGVLRGEGVGNSEASLKIGRIKNGYGQLSFRSYRPIHELHATPLTLPL